MTIKVLLIAGTIGFGLLLFRERVPGQRQALRRIAGLTAAALGIVAVLFPPLTTRIANEVGVGRGTDLVLYGFVMTFLYNAVATSQRIYRLEATVTQLTRELALLEATSRSKSRAELQGP